MKTFVLCAFLAIVTKASFSQLAVSATFNATQPGLFYTVGPSLTYGHHRFGAGINFNQSYSPADAHDMQWNLKPNDVGEYFGANFSYNYVFYPSQSAIEPYVFADINYQYCGFRNPVAHDFGDALLFSTEPMSTFTEIAGIGFTTQIYKHLYIDMKGGFGAYQQQTVASSFTYKVGAGLQYRFGSDS